MSAWGRRLAKQATEDECVEHVEERCDARCPCDLLTKAQFDYWMADCAKGIENADGQEEEMVQPKASGNKLRWADKQGRLPMVGRQQARR